jgi:lantibiotic leader peptide-processing serine protease
MLKHAMRWFAMASAVAFLAACATPTEVADWTTWEDGYADYALLAGDGAVETSRSGPGRYILSSAGALRGVEAAAARRGDTLVYHMPAAGFAVVETRDPGAYARLANVIVRDRVVQWTDPTRTVAFAAEVGDPPFSGSADFFFDLQWGHVPVRATAAWNAGVRGANTRVAVIDGGFDLTHPDLVPNINFALSKNFVAGEELQYAFPDPFSHGAHVAGTIAAAENDFGVIGVAPEAELVLIKVLGDAGSGSFADVGAGMLHAADVGADIANMSLGAQVPQRGICDQFGCITAREVAALRVFMQRIANYVTWKGTLLISSAGNSALDLDTTADLVVFPAGLARVMSVSATAPEGWATDPLNTDFDRLASYSNYGRSGIDVSAPGGDFMYPGEEPCTVAGLTRPCWVFDLVFSTGNQGWYWSAGTSMAAPHAAGVAALILSEHGGSGSMNPAQLERALIQRAADLGEPGRDKVHGKGAVQSGY